MHPFGGTPICPRCNKAVYLAEQPCLACMTCGKRLDSFSLVEHDQENFGTRDLRHANLPDRDDVFISPPTSPTRATSTLPPLPARSTPVSTRTTSHTGTPSSTAPALPVRRTQTGGGPFDRSKSVVSPPPILRPTRALSPIRGTAADPHRASTNGNTDTNGATQIDTVIEQTEEMKDVKMEGGDTEDEEEQVEKHLTQEPPDSPVKFTPTHTHTGRSIGGLPRTIPLTPFMTSAARPTHTPNSSINSFSIPDSDGAIPSNMPTGPITPMKSYQATPLTISKSSSLNSISSVGSNGTGGRIHVPLTATLSNGTGTRYGAALGGMRGTPTGSPRTWGGGTPTCGKCGKTVYFAEQVKAIGKTFHKGCLRCTECNTSLDSSRLTEKEGSPYCHRCYGKLYGPQGSGYALLGKPGG